MSLLFSSHLLPDVEAVCDYVLVLSRGTLLEHGRIQDLKQAHQRMFEVRVKSEPEKLAHRLAQAGCGAEPHNDTLRVRLPEGADEQLFWKAAAETGTQIRMLRPLRSTLEEVFLKAVEEHG